MARYIGATCRISRRLGTDLGLKSRARDITTKCKLGVPPGQHGQKRSKETGYKVQLREKQKLRYLYGVQEKQFRRYYQEAVRRQGATGHVLLKLLEGRLDTVVHRLGFGCTRAESRQLVKHKSILVNGRGVNVPSYQVQPGDKIEVAEHCRGQLRIQSSLNLNEGQGVPEWLSLNAEEMSGIFKRVPERNELPSEFNEQLVVELYSK